MTDNERLIAKCYEAKDLIYGDDGFLVFWPTSRGGGAFSADHLRTIADEMDRANGPWSDQIAKALGNV